MGLSTEFEINPFLSDSQELHGNYTGGMDEQTQVGL